MSEAMGEAMDGALTRRFPRRAMLAGGTAMVAGLSASNALQGAAGASTGGQSGLPVFDITQAPFNADPTGSADATLAISAAIAAAGSSGHIYAPPGTYKISGAPSGYQPLRVPGDGIFEGAGASGPQNAATVFKCADATAGIVFLGAGLMRNFLIDGGNVATLPLQRGQQLQGPQAYGTFMNVGVINSAQDGWTIISAQNDGYYNCFSAGNARDNLYIDGGAGGLEFFHWNDYNSGRYGIHGDGAVQGLPESYGGWTEGIRFFGGITEMNGQSQTRIYLVHAVDWAFPKMQINGNGLSGPTIHVDQGTCYGVDLSGALIWSTTNPPQPGLVIDGNPGYGGLTFLDNAWFVGGGASVSVGPNNPLISALGMIDHTVNGPTQSSGAQDVNTLLVGRTGPWLKAPLAPGWSGTLVYRIAMNSRVEFRGSISGPNATGAFALPAGYRPSTDVVVLAPMGSGSGVIAVAQQTGAVTVNQDSGTTAGGVSFDGVSFPTT